MLDSESRKDALKRGEGLTLRRGSPATQDRQLVLESDHFLTG